MANASFPSPIDRRTADVPAALGGKWGWFVALGIVSIVGGFIALSSLFLATVVSVLLVGAMMVMAGVFEIVHGFQMRTWGRFFLWVLIGALYVLAGIFTYLNPLLASAVLTLLLGVGLIAAGIVRLYLAFNMKSGTSWGWIALSAAITLLLGAMILFGWPTTSLFTLGIFLGIDLIINGVTWLAFGMALRGARNAGARPPTAGAAV